MELEVGKWYDFGDGSYSKFLKLSTCGNYFHFTELIRDKKHKFYKGNWYNSTVRLINISEISEYLPKNHPDINIIHEIW